MIVHNPIYSFSLGHGKRQNCKVRFYQGQLKPRSTSVEVRPLPDWSTTDLPRQSLSNKRPPARAAVRVGRQSPWPLRRSE